MITTGVAAKWNQPLNFGGVTAANFSRSLASLLMYELYGLATGFRSRTDLTVSDANAATKAIEPVM